MESHKNKDQLDGCADTKQRLDPEEKKSIQSVESFQKKEEDGNPSDKDDLVSYLTLKFSL